MDTNNKIAIGLTASAKESIKRFYASNFKSDYINIEDDIDFDAVYSEIAHKANSKDMSDGGSISHEILWHHSKTGATVAIDLKAQDLLWAIDCDSDHWEFSDNEFVY